MMPPNKVPLRGTFRHSPGPSCAPLRGACMVFHTKSGLRPAQRLRRYLICKALIYTDNQRCRDTTFSSRPNGSNLLCPVAAVGHNKLCPYKSLSICNPTISLAHVCIFLLNINAVGTRQASSFARLQASLRLAIAYPNTGFCRCPVKYIGCVAHMKLYQN